MEGSPSAGEPSAGAGGPGTSSVSVGSVAELRQLMNLAATHDPEMLQYLQHGVHDELFVAGDEEEIVRRVHLRDAAVVEQLLAMAAYDVTEDMCAARGWPWRAFRRCRCPSRCIVQLARRDGAALDRQVALLREATARAESAKQLVRSHRESCWAKDFGAGASATPNLAAALAEKQAADEAVAAVLGDSVETVTIQVFEALRALDCCRDAAAGLVNRSPNYFKCVHPSNAPFERSLSIDTVPRPARRYVRKRGDAGARSTTSRVKLRLSAAAVLHAPCCRRGCLTLLTVRAAVETSVPTRVPTAARRPRGVPRDQPSAACARSHMPTCVHPVRASRDCRRQPSR
jgi:hypothetical protein